MKRTKRFLSMLLAVVLMLSLTISTAFAAEANKGSITVENKNTEVSINGKEYQAYKIFDMTQSTTDASAVSYRMAADFKAFFADKKITTDKAAVEYVSGFAANSAELDAFAKEVYNYITKNSISAESSAVAVNEKATISNLSLGYYLVYGTAAVNENGEEIVSLCMLDSTTPDMIVNPKLDVPSISKQVKEDSENAWGDVADYGIGDNVPFKLTSKVPDMRGYEKYTYTVHDKMSAGLTFQNDVEVKIGGKTFTDFTVKTNELSDGCTMEIVFGDSFLSQTKDAAIEITYSAVLNKDAVIFSKDNPNEVYLEYSNNPYDTNSKGETPKDEVKVYTYEVNILKYTGDLNSEDIKYLADAKFELKTENDTQADAIRFVKDEKTNTYRVATADDKDTTTQLVSGTDGKIKVEGLDEGTYYLFETEAPDGYNPLDGSVKITITRDYDTGEFSTASSIVKTYVNGTENGTVNVLNNAGSTLPSTGGMGTTILYVVGIILVIGAAVVFVARRRVNAGR